MGKIKLNMSKNIKEEQEIINIDMHQETPSAQISNGQLLILSLKVTSLNLKTLHRNLTGGDWFVIHPLIGDYYAKIDEFEDTIIENLMPLGVKDIEVRFDERAPIIEARNYEEHEAMGLTKAMFDNILNLTQEVRKEIDIPTSVAPIFDEIENWLHVESNYKLNKYLGK